METLGEPKLLRDTRVYLSGPMDFVASRADEKRHGWRSRMDDFLRALGVVVFDPWFKPAVRGLHEYGQEGEKTAEDRDRWRFEPTEEAVKVRAELVDKYWQTMHIDLRMVDTSDFVICYCPTNIYSVGTPHELVVAREQHKPVLFVSPPIDFPSLDDLKAHLEGDAKGLELLARLEVDAPIKRNPNGVPSLWYMPLIGPNNFFDGFGFNKFREAFGWERTPIDDHEDQHPPARPLLPFIRKLNDELPKRWNSDAGRWDVDDDWILWELQKGGEQPGADVERIYHAGDPTGEHDTRR
jgi:hypothetical protein